MRGTDSFPQGREQPVVQKALANLATRRWFIASANRWSLAQMLEESKGIC
jgi:hypothetical protein